MPGPTEYWNQSAIVIASVKRRTARLRPVVPAEVDPKHELHKDPADEQKQYVAASESVEP
jgi:hypothetical protein